MMGITRVPTIGPWKFALKALAAGFKVLVFFEGFLVEVVPFGLKGAAVELRPEAIHKKTTISLLFENDLVC